MVQIVTEFDSVEHECLIEKLVTLSTDNADV